MILVERHCINLMHVTPDHAVPWPPSPPPDKARHECVIRGKAHATTMKIRANTVNSGVLDHHAPHRHDSIIRAVQACAARAMREIPEPSRPRKTLKAGLSR